MTVSSEIEFHLEKRIRKAMGRIRKERYPIIIELAGLPRLGKTTFSDLLVDLLKQSGYKVRLCSYATHSSPIDNRWTFDFSAWTLFKFLSSYLELRHSGVHFIVADRGLFDAITWLRLKMEDGLCDDPTLSKMRAVAYSDPWLSSLCIVLAFIGNPESILRRFRVNKLYQGESSITTEPNLMRLTNSIETEAALWNQERSLVSIFDTRDEGVNDTMRKAAEIIVTSLESFSSKSENVENSDA